MISEMILSSEGLSTNVTGIGPFIGMCPFMDEQVVGLRKLTVAIFANELFLRAGAGYARSP